VACGHHLAVDQRDGTDGDIAMCTGGAGFLKRQRHGVVDRDARGARFGEVDDASV
jgi:hypothetical protein